MAERKPLYQDQTRGYHAEIATSDSITLGGLTMGGNIDMASAGKIVNANPATADGDALVYGQAGANLAGLAIDTSPLTMNGQKITGMGAPAADADAATKEYVDQQVTQGRVWKEAVLHELQLDDTDGVNAAAALTMAANPVSGDTIVLTDGTTTRTYGAGTGGDVQYTIGATVADTMANLVAAIEGDASSIWGAVFSTDLDAIDTDGVVVIIEDANSGAVFRVYGTWATQASIQHVDFDGELDYTSKTLSTLDTTDPTAASPNSGFRRTQVSLVDGETHVALESDIYYVWDDSGNTWQAQSGATSIPDATAASGGGIKGKVTFDSDKGLAVTSGVAEVALAATAGLKFSTGALAVEPNDFAGTGLEDDGSDNLRLAAQGNGIAGGGGTTLSVDPDSETGGNTQPVSVGVNGVGLDVNAIAGTGIEADGSANLRLATQGNGIAGGGGTTLSVDSDTETGGDTVGVSVTANGVGLDVSALAGDGLKTDGDGVLDVKLEASNPSLQIVTDELGVKLSDGLTKDANGVAINLDATGSALEFTGAAGDGTLGVKVDGATITINGSNQLVAAGADEATRVENPRTTATDAVAVADPVYINGADTVGKAAANTDVKADVIGVIRSGSGAAPQSVEVVSHGPAAGVLSGATAGAVYFLQPTGGIGTSLPSAGNRVIQIGYALNATDLFVLVKDFAKRAA